MIHFFILQFLVIVAVDRLQAEAASVSSSSKKYYSTASFSFIHPLTRPSIRSSPRTVLQPSLSEPKLVQKVTRCRGFTFATAAKRKGAAGAPASSTTKKIQVKLLKNVAGIGQKGDIVRVSPAVLNNILRPTQSARAISDEQVQQEQAATAALERETERKAMALKEEIESLKLNMVRKAGPDGKLFGGIGPKAIIDELKDRLGSSGQFLDGKGVKILALVDEKGAEIRGDIKHVGAFGATVLLTKDVSAKIKAEVQSEN